MMSKTMSSALALAMTAGLSGAQPTVDGTRAGDESFYDSIIWVQNTPTNFGNNEALGPCDPTDIGMPGMVDTGVEICIPMAELQLFPGDSIRIAGFINSQGHDFASSQIIAGPGGEIPATADGLQLGDPRFVDFSDSVEFPGDQFVSITLPATPGSAAVTVDGTLDAQYVNVFTQTIRTSFGDANDGNPDFTNGSEIDGLYYYLSDNGTAGDSSDDQLYLFVAGNLESNYNKLELFLDTVMGFGDNTLAETGNPDVDFGALQRMGTDTDGDPENGPDGPGLTFDAGFTANFYFTLGNGNTAAEGEPEDHGLFPNWARIGGSGFGLGEGGAQSNGDLFEDFDDMTGPDPSGLGIKVTLDNSNTAGVPGTCPPPAGDRDNAIGSEINGVYAHLDDMNNRLYVLVTGNLQSNFNKLDLFLDADAMDGQNELHGSSDFVDPMTFEVFPRNVDIDFGGLTRMGYTGNGFGDPENGLTFDTGFEADYWISVTNGSNGTQVFSNAAVLRSNGARVGLNGEALDYGASDGGDKTMNDPIPFDGPQLDAQDSNPGTLANLFTGFAPRTAAESLDPDPTMPVGTPNLLEVAIDNSNIDGVSDFATDDVSGAAAVQTGIEFSIDLTELGWDGGDIRLAGFVSSGGHDFVSNQVIGGLPRVPAAAKRGADLPSDNLGEVTMVDFSEIDGDQFVLLNSTTVECPGDINTTGTTNGVPDGQTNLSDLQFFLTNWQNDLGMTPGSLADVNTTGTTNGMPDGEVNLSDLQFFLTQWQAGLGICP